MAVLDPKDLRVGPGGGRKPSPYAGQTVLQPVDLARAAGALPMPEPAPAPMGWGGWKCDAAKWACRNWNLGCGYANSATCNRPKPPAPPPPVYSQVSAKECDSQESPTAIELGLCDEELCNLAAHLDMWSFAPDTDWSKCYVEPNGDPVQCRLKCPGAKKAPGIGTLPKPCPGVVVPAGCKGKCCFRYGDLPMACDSRTEASCLSLADEKDADKKKLYSSISFNCSPKCDAGVP